MKLVIYPAVEDARLVKITDAAESMTVVNCADEETAIQEIADANALFGRLTPPMLAAATQLRWVQSPTASLEHYIFPELAKHPCTLTNMRGLYSDVIADHVLGYILCFARNLHLYLRQQMRAEWSQVGGGAGSTTTNFIAGPGTVSGMDRAHLHISDCTMGVVGVGAIGREIVRRGLAFGMRVVGVDPIQTEGPEGMYGLWPMDRLDELLGMSDFVVVAAPHTPETEGLFQRDRFKAMLRTAYFINIGRGAIVSLNDLVSALDTGTIAGAALDVFEIEPLPTDHPLWKQENVILTPHVAACSVHIAERHLEVVVENVRHFVRGEPLINVADKEKWF